MLQMIVEMNKEEVICRLLFSETLTISFLRATFERTSIVKSTPMKECFRVANTSNIEKMLKQVK